MALLAQTVDPEMVVLGGGVADAGPGLLEAVQDALRRRASRSPVLAAIHLADRVALVPTGCRPERSARPSSLAGTWQRRAAVAAFRAAGHTVAGGVASDTT